MLYSENPIRCKKEECYLLDNLEAFVHHHQARHRGREQKSGHFFVSKTQLSQKRGDIARQNYLDDLYTPSKLQHAYTLLKFNRPKFCILSPRSRFCGAQLGWT